MILEQMEFLINSATMIYKIWKEIYIFVGGMNN